MKEIGGYIEFEHYHRTMLHEDAIKLNCGRNCLAYLIQARGISKLALPYFLCDSVRNLCLAYGVQVRYYHINEAFLPEETPLEPDEWLYVVDYYGQLTREQAQALVRTYNRVIFDYAQAYFERPADGADTLYTCRKFFGVADGAILYTDVRLNERLQTDESFERMGYLLGRFERPASEFYGAYVDNNRLFAAQPVKRMSLLTENLLRGVDYEWVKSRRTENYACLARLLGERNLLSLRSVEGAFAYPLMLENGAQVRQKLIAQKVYVPTLWPNVLEDVPADTLEYRLTNNVLPLPCDQRYSVEDMEALSALVVDSL